MNDILQSINSSEVNLLGAIFKLAFSLILGAVIGLERRRKGQIAGMRTFALISMGATLAMLVSIYIPQEYMGLKNGDPGRIAAQVISGIGFLGAGAIIQMKGSVKGLTTAAGIWAAAAIGLAIGSGMYAIASAAALLILFILTVAERLEHSLFQGGESKIIRLKTAYIIKDMTPYHDTFKRFGIHISDEFLRYDYHNSQTIVNFIIRSHRQTDFMRLFDEMHTHGTILSLTLTNEMNN